MNRRKLDYDKIASAYNDGRKLSEIAAIVGTTENVISTVMSRMRKTGQYNLPYRNKPKKRKRYSESANNVAGSFDSMNEIAQRICNGIKDHWTEISSEDLLKLQAAYRLLTSTTRKNRTMNTLKNRKNRRARRAHKRAVANGTARKANRYFPGRPTASANPATKSKKTISLQELDANRIPDPILDRSRVENEIKATNGNKPKEVIAPTIEEWEEIIAKARKQRKSIRTIAPKFGWILREDENPRLIDSWYK